MESRSGRKGWKISAKYIFKSTRDILIECRDRDLINTPTFAGYLSLQHCLRL